MNRRHYERQARERAQALVQAPERAGVVGHRAAQRARRNARRLKPEYDSLRVMARLAQAWGEGRYANISRNALVALLAALMYFLMPVDAVPDFLWPLGFVDDLAVLARVSQHLRRELAAFRAWEPPTQQGRVHEEPAGPSRLSALEYEDIAVFSLVQRLNRLRFACYLLTGVVSIALFMVLTSIYMRAVWMPEAGVWALAGVLVGLWVLGVLWHAVLVVRRLHDAGQPGWWLLLFLLAPVAPFLAPFGAWTVWAALLPSVLLGLYLLFAPGSPGSNEFGPPNPPNGALVMLFGGLTYVLYALSLAALLVMVALVVIKSPDELRQLFMQGPGQGVGIDDWRPRLQG